MNFFQKIKLRKELKKHIARSLDIKEILTREDDINVVVDAYEYFMRQSDWEVDGRFSLIVKDFLLCVQYDGEVANGGISQFFSNSSGDFAEETANALHNVDAKDAELLLRKGISLFPNGSVPKDREIRNDLMVQIDEEQLDQLDKLQWECDVSSACYQFLMDNIVIFINS